MQLRVPRWLTISALREHPFPRGTASKATTPHGAT